MVRRGRRQERHLIFATDLQLELLRKARRWFDDGTFDASKAPFSQLFSLQLNRPILFALYLAQYEETLSCNFEYFTTERRRRQGLLGGVIIYFLCVSSHRVYKRLDY